jgi:hypothetical protein
MTRYLLFNPAAPFLSISILSPRSDNEHRTVEHQNDQQLLGTTDDVLLLRVLHNKIHKARLLVVNRYQIERLRVIPSQT